MALSDTGSRAFDSKKQWRYFFVNPRLGRWAHQKAHATQRARGGKKVAYRSLPTYSRLSGRLGVGRATRQAKGLRVKNRG